MNETLETLKTKIKQNAPEICFVIGATAAIVGIAMTVKLPSTKLPLDFELDLPKSVIKHMTETGENLIFDTPKLKLLVKLTDN